MPAAAFDPRTIDNFLNDLDKAVSKGIADKAAKKDEKKLDAATDKATSLFKNVFSLLKLLSPAAAKMTADEREKLLEDALSGLAGGLIGEKGDELSGSVRDFIDICRGKLTDAEKKKKLEDAVKKLVTKATSGATGAKDKDVGTIVDSIWTLIQLGMGTLSDAERQKLLEDNALKLVTTDFVKRQLTWFVSENFMTYFQAVKIGYDLGKPFGDALAKDLAPIAKARYGEDFLIALEQKDPGWSDKVTAGHEAVHVMIEGGSFQGWQGTAFWDYTVNDVRIQIVTGTNNVFLLDGNGVDRTNEPRGLGPSDDGPAPSTEGLVKDGLESNVARAYEDAQRDPKVKDLERTMTAAKAKADETLQRAEDAHNAHNTAEETRLNTQWRMEFSEYWRIRESWKRSIHDWFLKAAKAERWGTVEYNYMWQHFRIFAYNDYEIGMAVPSGASVGGVYAMPRAVSRAGMYALIGTIVLALLGVAAFAATRGNGPSVASEATANATTARPSGSVNPTQAAGNIICTPAPDISITLSGAASGTATKACEPWVNLAQRNARPNTPYCRLEGIPNKPNVNAGVYASQVMFMLNGTKYLFIFQYVADVRDPATGGTLPATLPIGNGDGILQMRSYPATDEIPGRGTVAWQPASGSFTIGADGTTGSIDADFTSNDGRTLHAKGTWQVAKGCPPVGN